MPRRRTAADLVYRVLLRAYPREFRRQYGDDMIEMFRDQHRAEAERGAGSVIALWAHVVVDALRNGLPERAGAARRFLAARHRKEWPAYLASRQHRRKG